MLRRAWFSGANRRRAMSSVGLALVVSLVWFWTSSSTGRNAIAGHDGLHGLQADQAFPWARGAATGAAASRFQSGLEDLPRSLQGTEVDGDVDVDGAGRLKVTGALRDLFDYFLSTLGEEPLTTVHARLQAYLRSHLPAGAAGQALALLDRYIAYKQDRQQLGQGTDKPSLSELQRRADALRALRSRYFSPDEVQAFFGDESAQDDYTLARMKTMQDETLTPQAKARRLAELADALPVALKAALGVEDKVQNLAAITQDWKAHGGTPQELRAAREQLVGAEAADRLEALDRERAAWDARVQAWRAQRQALQADASLSDAQRQHQIAQLMERLFNSQERLRVQALDSAAASATTAAATPSGS